MLSEVISIPLPCYTATFPLSDIVSRLFPHVPPHQVRKLEMELQWVMVMELEKNVGPLEEHLAKEKSRLPRNQHTITKAEVCGLHHPIQSCKMAKLLGGLKGGVSSQNNVHFVHDKESLVRSVTYVKQPLTYVW